MAVTREELESIEVGQSYHFTDEPEYVYTRVEEDKFVLVSVENGYDVDLEVLIAAHTDEGMFGESNYTLVKHNINKED